MNISKILDRELSVDLNKAKEILEKAEEKITFWGGRKVVIQGYLGSVDLDWLAGEVLSAEYKGKGSYNFPLQTRIAGIDIVKKIHALYDRSDKVLEKKNIITKFLFCIRHFSVHPYTTRFYFDDAGETFLTYEAEDYEKTFGHPFPRWSRYGPAPTCLATEEEVRALV